MTSSNLELALTIRTDLANTKSALASLESHLSKISGESQMLSGQAGSAAKSLSQLGDSAQKTVGSNNLLRVSGGVSYLVRLE